MRRRRKLPPMTRLIDELLGKAINQLAIARAAAARCDTPLAGRIADEIGALEELKAFAPERLSPAQYRKVS